MEKLPILVGFMFIILMVVLIVCGFVIATFGWLGVVYVLAGLGAFFIIGIFLGIIASLFGL